MPILFIHLLFQGFGEALDRGQRGPQLMADVRHEVPSHLLEAAQARDVVVGAAHTDDESLNAGGTLELVSDQRAQQGEPDGRIIIVTAFLDEAGVTDFFVALKIDLTFRRLIAALLNISEDEVSGLREADIWQQLSSKQQEFVADTVQKIRERHSPESWAEFKRSQRDQDRAQAKKHAPGMTYELLADRGLRGMQLTRPVFFPDGGLDLHFSEFGPLNDADRRAMQHEVDVLMAQAVDQIRLRGGSVKDLLVTLHAPDDLHPEHRWYAEALLSALASHAPDATVAFSEGLRSLDASHLPVNLTVVFDEPVMQQKADWIAANTTQVSRKPYDTIARELYAQRSPVPGRFAERFSVWKLRPVAPSPDEAAPARPNAVGQTSNGPHRSSLTDNGGRSGVSRSLGLWRRSPAAQRVLPGALGLLVGWGLTAVAHGWTHLAGAAGRAPAQAEQPVLAPSATLAT